MSCLKRIKELQETMALLSPAYSIDRPSLITKELSPSAIAYFQKESIILNSLINLNHNNDIDVAFSAFESIKRIEPTIQIRQNILEDLYTVSQNYPETSPDNPNTNVARLRIRRELLEAISSNIYRYPTRKNAELLLKIVSEQRTTLESSSSTYLNLSAGSEMHEAGFEKKMPSEMKSVINDKIKEKDEKSLAAFLYLCGNHRRYQSLISRNRIREEYGNTIQEIGDAFPSLKQTCETLLG